jgi:hypothetical protein
MQLGLGLASGTQVHEHLPHHCLPVNPGSDTGVYGAMEWALYQKAGTLRSSFPPSSQPSPALHNHRPHPEGDESQSVILSVNDFPHSDLHAIIHHMLLWPILGTFL